jgi:hypothetical protein
MQRHILEQQQELKRKTYASSIDGNHYNKKQRENILFSCSYLYFLIPALFHSLSQDLCVRGVDNNNLGESLWVSNSGSPSNSSTPIMSNKLKNILIPAIIGGVIIYINVRSLFHDGSGQLNQSHLEQDNQGSISKSQTVYHCANNYKANGYYHRKVCNTCIPCIITSMIWGNHKVLLKVFWGGK